jgi:catechol 2,3-dioxygenase-like lactoylglutathione lyase family enzyme
LTGVAVSACGFFVTCAGFGLGNWTVVAVGVAALALAVTLVVVAIVRGNSLNFVRGRAHVLTATEPIGSGAGRCEMQVVVTAPGMEPVKVNIVELRVPVDKWPSPRANLPVRVAIDDPRQVKVQWREVRSHTQEAVEDERFNTHVRRIVDAELGPEAKAPAAPPPPSPAPPPPPTPPSAAAPTVPGPRPSPRPRRPRPEPAAPSTATMTAVAVVDPATPPEPRVPVATAAVDEDIPVYDIVPIEGASAVLGVRPTPEETTAEEGTASEATSTAPASPPAAAPPRSEPAEASEDDAAAVADLLAAYPGPVRGGAGAIRGIGVRLIVTDLNRSVAFYRDVLGFVVLDSGPVSAVLASGETRIMLRRVSDMAPVDRRLVHIHLEVGDVEAVYADLLAKGVKFLHRPRPIARGEQMDLWAAAFRDPDGHGIALIRWQPRGNARPPVV